MIGVLAVQRHPELYYAWLGSGQMVDPRETDRGSTATCSRGDAPAATAGSCAGFEGYGAPPYDSVFAYADVMGYYDELAGDYDPPAYYTRLGESSGVGFLGLMAPEYGLVDKVNAVRGLMDVFSVLYPQWQGIDFRRTAEHLAVPVYVFTGDHELGARRELSVEWFRALDAPVKRLYSFENAGHATAFEHVRAFTRILERVELPVTGPSDREDELAAHMPGLEQLVRGRGLPSGKACSTYGRRRPSSTSRPSVSSWAPSGRTYWYRWPAPGWTIETTRPAISFVRSSASPPSGSSAASTCSGSGSVR